MVLGPLSGPRPSARNSPLHNGQTAENYDVPVKIVFAIERNTRFVKHFVPHKALRSALNIAKALSADPEGPLKIFDQHAAVGAPGPADTAPKGIKGAPFSRLVVFWLERDPALQQLEQIKSLFQDKNITVEFPRPGLSVRASAGAAATSTNAQVGWDTLKVFSHPVPHASPMRS